MFHIRIEGGELERMETFLRALVDELLDVRVAAKRLEPVLVSANARARQAGIDGEGNRLADLSEERIKRRRAEGKGNGPPLVPDETGSTLIIDAEPESFSRYSTEATVVLRYRNAPWLRFHRQGAPPLSVPSHRKSWVLPKRDIVGFDPAMKEDIATEFGDWLAEATQEAASRARSVPASGGG